MTGLLGHGSQAQWFNIGFHESSFGQRKKHAIIRFGSFASPNTREAFPRWLNIHVVCAGSLRYTPIGKRYVLSGNNLM